MVSTEEYARVSSDLAAAQNEIETLQGKLDAKERELQTVQSELFWKQAKLEATDAILTEVGGRLAFVEAVDIPILKGDVPDEFILQFYKQWITQRPYSGDEV